MPKSALSIIILAALSVIGCAHQPEETSATFPVNEVASAPEQKPRPRPNLLLPEKDPRYHLPEAKARALTIFLDSQTFEYVEDGEVFASGEVTTGEAAHPTPAGSFRVLSKDIDKRSRSYTNYFEQPTPMPYSLQFYGPYYVHEGYMPGHPDSHGCVRLRYENARLLFERMRVGDPIVVKKTGVARSTDPIAQLFPVF